MQHHLIEYQGSYRYADRAALERALARARAELAAEEGLEHEEVWVRWFVTSGTTVTVNLRVPAVAEQRFAAANVFLILAHGATEGAVAARRGDTPLDVYASGDDEEPA